MLWEAPPSNKRVEIMGITQITFETDQFRICKMVDLLRLPFCVKIWFFSKVFFCSIVRLSGQWRIIVFVLFFFAIFDWTKKWSEPFSSSCTTTFKGTQLWQKIRSNLFPVNTGLPKKYWAFFEKKQKNQDYEPLLHIWNVPNVSHLICQQQRITHPQIEQQVRSCLKVLILIQIALWFFSTFLQKQENQKIPIK